MGYKLRCCPAFYPFQTMTIKGAVDQEGAVEQGAVDQEEGIS